MRHHYVPQFLLRSWATYSIDEKVEVYRLDLDRLTSTRHSPKYTAYEDNLYALTRPMVAGMEQQAIEKYYLKLVDNYGAHVRDKLLGQGLRSLTIKERKDWTIFLMSLRLRQPDIMEMLRDQAAIQLRTILAAQPEKYEELAGINDPLTLEEWTEQQFPGLIENFGLGIFQNLVNNPNIGNRIIKMKWWLWDFSEVNHDLLIADHPCIFTSGIDDPRLIMALPISPKVVFMTTQDETTANSLRSQRPRELAMRINESSVAQARIRLYSQDKSPERFIFNRLQKIRAGLHSPA